MFNNVALPLIIIWLLTVLRYNLIICIDYSYTMVFIIYNINCTINTIISIFCKRDDQYSGACPGGGGRIEKKKKKKKKKGIRANIKLFHLYFATFLVENVFFSASFWAGPPPWKSEKQKKKNKLKKRLSDFGPPSCEFLDTRLVFILLNKYYDQMIGWSIFILLVLWSADDYDY